MAPTNLLQHCQRVDINFPLWVVAGEHPDVARQRRVSQLNELAIRPHDLAAVVDQQGCNFSMVAPHSILQNECVVFVRCCCPECVGLA